MFMTLEVNEPETAAAGYRLTLEIYIYCSR
jgi:hypothetical protein